MKAEIINAAWLDSHTWGVRSSNDGVAYGGFVWASVGDWTTAPDWHDRSECGGGLHIETPSLHGFGGFGARLELVEIDGPVVAIDGNKGKCARARIVAISADIPDEAFTRCGYAVHRAGSRDVRDGEHVIALGRAAIRSVTGGRAWAYGHATIRSVAGGRAWAYGRATIRSVAGGWAWAYGHATIRSVAGGRAWAYGLATIQSVTGGRAQAYGRATIQGVAGGEARACDRATIQSVTGGRALAYDRAAIRSVTGGRAFAYDRATIPAHVKQ